VQSFLDKEVTVTVSVAGASSSITDLVSGKAITRAQGPAPAGGRRGGRGGAGGGGGGGGRGGAAAPGTSYTITLPAHSYRAFTAQD